MEQTILTMEQESAEESPTRYVLPEQVNKEETGGSGLVDYTLNEQSPAKTPITTKKRKKSQEKTKSKENSSISCQSHNQNVLQETKEYSRRNSIC